jgi:hypothetical protein
MPQRAVGGGLCSCSENLRARHRGVPAGADSRRLMIVGYISGKSEMRAGGQNEGGGSEMPACNLSILLPRRVRCPSRAP